jgi:sugar phosphate isomerase/epimerase
MQLALPGRPHLTYCTNIHQGETWAEIEAKLARYLPEVKARVSPDASMGVGLRLSGEAAASLAAAARLKALRAFLATEDLYVFTINAFPYGPFHGRPVKERVYEPDWRTPERLAFTNLCADILAELLPDGMQGSVSTVPGAFRPKLRSDADVTLMAETMIRHAAHLHAIAKRSGKRITLALEPEPSCALETTDDAIVFFKDHLFARGAVALMRRLTGLEERDAEMALKNHLGLCFDVCHAAVEFERVEQSLNALRAAGIDVAKIQLSSAIRIPHANGDTERLLKPFDDGIYLHQTVESRNGVLARHVDLPDAFAALHGAEGACGEWRVQCHVPVFLESFGGLSSTQSVLKDMLALCRERAVAPHLEIETYTWSVLPPGLRSGDLGADIAREVQWVRSQLRA